MNMAIASLIALAAAIILGFVRKLNVGIVAIALAYIIGIAYGLSAKQITGGFSSSMAMTMIGVMYLFAIVSKNGTLELLAKKITDLAHGNRYLLYVAIYVIGIILSGVGPGAIPTLAIVPVLAIPVALKAGMNPILLSLIGQMGAQCVRMCPITPEAVVVRDLMVEQGLDGSTLPAMWSLWATEIVMIIACFIFFKGWKFDKPLESVELEKASSFSPKQILTLIGLLAMIACVVVFGFDVGLTSLVVGTILLVFGDQVYSLEYHSDGSGRRRTDEYRISVRRRRASGRLYFQRKQRFHHQPHDGSGIRSDVLLRFRSGRGIPHPGAHCWQHRCGAWRSGKPHRADGRRGNRRNHCRIYTHLYRWRPAPGRRVPVPGGGE